MRYALVIGFFITALWTGIGFYFWDSLISISSRMIELLPFSMVRSNGAWMLSTFLWLQAVLLTFALIYAFFGNIILRSVSKEKYTSFSLIVAAMSAFGWAAVWYFKGDYIYQQFLKLLTWLPFETMEKGIAFLIGFYLIYNAIIATLLFAASIFSEPLLIVLPLLFIPLLNIVIIIALWMWLVKDTLTYDAASLSYEKVDKEELKKHKGALWFITLVSTLFNLIPVLNLFGPYFGEIAMFHYMKRIQKQQ